MEPAVMANLGRSQMKLVNLTMWAKGSNAMDSDVIDTDEDILTCEIADDALERAAVATEAQVTTIGVCTHWYHCSWPL
jgi:hypothetical protein